MQLAIKGGKSFLPFLVFFYVQVECSSFFSVMIKLNMGDC